MSKWELPTAQQPGLRSFRGCDSGLLQSPRFYTVRATILEWDASDLGNSGDNPSPDDPPAGSVQWPDEINSPDLPPGWDDYGTDNLDPFDD